MNDHAKGRSRREFFRAVARGLALGTLAAGAGLLALRNGRDDCRFTNPCAACRLREDCDLDRRREARRTEG